MPAGTQRRSGPPPPHPAAPAIVPGLPHLELAEAPQPTCSQTHPMNQTVRGGSVSHAYSRNPRLRKKKERLFVSKMNVRKHMQFEDRTFLNLDVGVR